MDQHKIERYATHADYCDTAVYQQWLATWTPPANAQVDVWINSSENNEDIPMDNAPIQTPRHHGLTRWTTRLPFHLLDSLGISTLPCVDIGCGYNWFKRFYPSIWGVDPNNAPYRDEILTPDWYRVNGAQWSHAFSCCAMHFCDQSEVSNQVAKIRDILRPSGTAVIALNRARIQEQTKQYDSEHLYQTLAHTPGLTRMVWIDQPHNSGMDGNVWIWITN